MTSDDPLIQFEDLAGEFAGLVASPNAAPDPSGRVSGAGAPRQVVTSGAQRLVDVESTPVGIQGEDPVWR